MQTFSYNNKYRNYKYIWKDILRIIYTFGNELELESDNKGKHSSGKIRELTDVTIYITNPKLPTTEEINSLIPKIGKKFLNNMMIFQGSFQHDRIIRRGQIDNIINILETRPLTRKAVFTVFLPNDFINKYTTCTIGGQFLIRDNKLSLRVFMRSVDAYNGLMGNMFGFITLLYYVANQLGIDVSEYIHYSTSLHIYGIDYKDILRIIKSE